MKSIPEVLLISNRYALVAAKISSTLLSRLLQEVSSDCLYVTRTVTITSIKFINDKCYHNSSILEFPLNYFLKFLGKLFFNTFR